MIDYLDSLSVDWTDFEEAGRLTRDIVTTLAHDKETLRKLVLGVESQPHLLALCERHQLLDYLVLYEALDRGVRLRLHISTDNHFDRPHDHRFSFSSHIVTGGYNHTWYKFEGDQGDLYRAPDADVTQYMSRDNPDPSGPALLDRLAPHLTRWEGPGSCYTLHHSAIHTTFTTPDTVSLFLRGPAEKSRSVILDSETRTMWWRFGREQESAARRVEKTMAHDVYKNMCDRLETLAVI